MTTDLQLMMRIQAATLDISLDTDLDADTKLFALLLCADIGRRSTLSRREKLAETNGWMARIDERAGRRHFCWSVIRRDVPRYERDPGTGVCVADMIRRESPCGKRIYRRVNDIDPLTGREVVTGYCTRHWSLDHQKRALDRRRQWIDNGQPRPPANAGGLLRRHFTTDWNGYYDWAAPERQPAEGITGCALPRPLLTLIQGETS